MILSRWRLAGLAFCLAVVFSASACNKTTSSLPDIGVDHNEPVVYNGERYTVRFIYNRGANVYDVTVMRPGKALTSDESDGAAAHAVARSTVGHYACPARTKGRVRAGTERFVSGAQWLMQVECARSA